MTPVDFRGAFFTPAHFQKIAQISSLCDFDYVSGGSNSFSHAIWVTNDLTAAGFVPVDFCKT